MEKIKIESRGISPWHYQLENLSWGSGHSGFGDDPLAVFRVDKGLKNGGRGLEDVLMADFLNSLDFLPDEFLNELLQQSGLEIELEQPEIRGNAGNYYLPHEDVNGIRLAQPDGWIADQNNLILLEAKGYRKSAALNKGQLAKEYLIAREVSRAAGMKNFYILLIAADFKNIYKSSGKCYDWAEFTELWQANLLDLDRAYGGSLSEVLPDWEEVKTLSADAVRANFLQISWQDISRLLRREQWQKFSAACEIVKAIDFHSSGTLSQDSFCCENWPVFSRLMAELAEQGAWLSEFYNGGCGNDILMKYEKIFLSAVNALDSPQAYRWQKWHSLKEMQKDWFEKLDLLEAKRRSGDVDFKSELKKFYCRLGRKNSTSTRRAYEFLGESARLEFVSAYFAQRNEFE